MKLLVDIVSPFLIFLECHSLEYALEDNSARLIVFVRVSCERQFSTSFSLYTSMNQTLP